jgi:hypothetical protein
MQQHIVKTFRLHKLMQEITPYFACQLRLIEPFTGAGFASPGSNELNILNDHRCTV